MLKIETNNGKHVLVSDDANAENAIVGDATEGTPFGDRWEDAPFADGEVRCEVMPGELSQLAEALQMAEDSGVQNVGYEVEELAVTVANTEGGTQ
jgi:hypothetical protein